MSGLPAPHCNAAGYFFWATLSRVDLIPFWGVIFFSCFNWLKLALLKYLKHGLSQHFIKQSNTAVGYDLITNSDIKKEWKVFGFWPTLRKWATFDPRIKKTRNPINEVKVWCFDISLVLALRFTIPIFWSVCTSWCLDDFRLFVILGEWLDLKHCIDKVESFIT